MKGRAACPLCEVLPTFPDRTKVLLVYTEPDLLFNKVLECLLGSGYKPEAQDEIVVLRDVPTKDVLLTLKQCCLSELETREIKVALLEDEKYGIGLLKSFKPLEVWLSYIENQDFFSILRNGSMTVYYQPILNYEERRVHGYECLLRAFKEDGSMVPPYWLFETAKKTGMLFYLDREARQVAIKEASKKVRGDEKVFINFTPTSIYDPAYCLKTTIEFACTIGVEPSKLVFEVVETDKVEDKKHLRTILEYYRSHGFRVALDDVGEGYSSLNLLIWLNPDYVKLSIELVRDIHKVSIKKDFVSALFSSLRKNGIEVIAEGVETKEELNQLLDIGVRLFQGFLFAKPAPEPNHVINWQD